MPHPAAVVSPNKGTEDVATAVDTDVPQEGGGWGGYCGAHHLHMLTTSHVKKQSPRGSLCEEQERLQGAPGAILNKQINS